MAVPGEPVELAQPDLDFLVPGEGAAPVGAEGPHQEVGVLDRDVQERPPAGRQEMGRGRLVQVADAIELVAHPEVRPALPARAGGGVPGTDRSAS